MNCSLLALPIKRGEEIDAVDVLIKNDVICMINIRKMTDLITYRFYNASPFESHTNIALELMFSEAAFPELNVETQYGKEETNKVMYQDGTSPSGYKHRNLYYIHAQDRAYCHLRKYIHYRGKIYAEDIRVQFNDDGEIIGATQVTAFIADAGETPKFTINENGSITDEVG